MFVTSKEMLLKAREGGYAVGAFNAENMEMVMAIVAAAEESRSPVMIQTTGSTLKYATHEMFVAMVGAAARAATVPVALHLDHGTAGLVLRAFRAGYTSVMIDGSKLPLEENIAITKYIADICMESGVPVEGELGRVGGKEDDIVSDSVGYTDPDEAVRFINETGVSSLAIGVGTAHGIYAKTPVLNVELISKIKSVTQIPLVLHGASGISDEAVRECVSRGICKVNFATELRQAYTAAVRGVLSADSEVYDPKKYGTPGMKAVTALVKNRMAVCGCAGKA